MAAPVPSSLLQHLRGLREALDRLHTDLSAGNPLAALDAEPLLASALAALNAGPLTIAAADRPALVTAMTEVRTALGRCRALGAAIDEMTRAAVTAAGGAAVYDPGGSHAALRRSHTLTARG